MRKRIMHWLWDGWPLWKPEWLISAVAWCLCRALGHEPIADQCGLPAHDFCVWCMKLMPFAAPRSVLITKETP